MKSKRRVVITGMGALAPNGNSVEEFWANTVACKSGIGPITLFDAGGFPVGIAGEVKQFRLEDYCDHGLRSKRLARSSQFCAAAAAMAIKHAGLDREALLEHAPLSIAMGISTSSMAVVEHNDGMLHKRGPRHVSPNAIAAAQPHAGANAIAEFLKLPTKRVTLASACPAGMDAISFGRDLVRDGKADLALVGGADASITPLSMASFNMAGLAPSFQRPPEQCSRPFDLGRQGGIISEGVGVLVIEDFDHAIDRGATPLAELLGYGSVTDDLGSPPGEGLSFTMREALANSGLHPEDIGYLSAHGPSHPMIDQVEAAMIKQVFGRHTGRMPVSSIKGVVGNPVSAAGPIQVIAAVMGLREGIVSPTANLEHPDPACDLDHVPMHARRVSMEHVMVNVHGMGGGNSSLILRRVDPA